MLFLFPCIYLSLSPSSFCHYRWLAHHQSLSLTCFGVTLSLGIPPSDSFLLSLTPSITHSHPHSLFLNRCLTLPLAACVCLPASPSLPLSRRFELRSSTCVWCIYDVVCSAFVQRSVMNQSHGQHPPKGGLPRCCQQEPCTTLYIRPYTTPLCGPKT